MAIGGWIISIIGSILIWGFCGFLMQDQDGKQKIKTAIIATVLCAALFGGFHWYYNNTASGRRELVDQQSNLSNGLNRTVIVYTANGDIIAKYQGKIDLEANDAYIKFDFEGKRYVYYNCFVETIGELP